jgi:hypothetical protein
MRGLEVRLVDPLPHYAPANFLGSRAPRVEALLEATEVRTGFGWQLQRVHVGAVEFSKDDARQTFECDRLIIAIDRRPITALIEPLRERGIKVQVIGDARRPRSYGNAIHEAAYLSRRL